MQVNSVSSNNVQSFGQRKAYQAPDGAGMEYRVLEGLANAKDSQLQGLAWKEASHAVNDKKHRRINNALYWGLPVAAGLAAVVRNPMKSAKGVSGRLLNLKTFAGTTLNWAGTFALIDAVFAGKNKLAKSSETVKDFDKKHPFLSFAAAIGAALGAVMLGSKGISKLTEAAAKHIKPDTSKKLGNLLNSFNQKLTDSKILNKTSELAGKIPSAIKGFAKGVVEWTPMMMILAQISHSFNHAAVKNNVAYQKYDELKTAREEARTILNDMETAQEDVAEA